jgi:hypothetical protein
MSKPVTIDSYVHHETGYWKVSAIDELVSVWREGEHGAIETAQFPAHSLRVVAMSDSPWTDPADL